MFVPGLASPSVLVSELVVVSLSPNIEISAGRGVLGPHQGNTGNTSRGDLLTLLGAGGTGGLVLVRVGAGDRSFFSISITFR